ncbi:alpha/beta hydrolase [Tenacibaculum aiptasiae]|uniref:Alpha/beta hydrolase n=1 Tax=Tenacibaculum aiptasiae TaxID=426481 RepID=A0A7J5AR19_9FLAO|nr:alpha/beta hydrolase-fold protein [Tenacibaculum aiptasiae]KAB1159982.1 alpha/beta hydrolase [Tenacibaculum aiptasiae]
MKKLGLAFLLCCCIYTVTGQNITIGKISSIHSKILNEERELWIHLPKGYGYHNSASEKERYPVVYLLDGNSHFYSLVGILQHLSIINTICPKMIVVGIVNTNRTRDLAPTKIDNSLKKGHSDSSDGDKFLSFIEHELIPYIDSTYDTDSYRTFIGHSLGGLTVLNVLAHKPELFNAYVSIDPAMSWDNKNLLNKIKNIQFDKKYTRKSLFLGIANTMNKGLDTLSVQKSNSKNTKHIRALLELNAFLKKDTLNNLSYKAKYYKNDTHPSVPLITKYDALRYIFDFYKPTITQQELLNPKSNSLYKLTKHYQRLSEYYGRKVKPSIHYVDSKGYELMTAKLYKKAEQFFKLNCINYPTSFRVYNSLGDLYLAMDKKDKALINFKKSYSLQETPYAKSQLDQLQNK